jgi:hypothetical protein
VEKREIQLGCRDDTLEVIAMGMIMLASFVIAVVAAIFLALRFKVFVLVPATLFAVRASPAINAQC